MLFFANPKRKAGKARRKMRRAKVRRVARRRTTTKGESMARRKRSRARRTVARRRRPTKRTRRFSAVRAFLPNPRRRRRFRRNPTGARRGIMGTIQKGVVDGLVILAAQASVRRVQGLVSGFVPIPGMAGKAVTGLGTAVAVTLLGRQFLPRFAPLIAAGAFAEGIRGVVSEVPGVGPLLADYESNEYYGTLNDGMGAWAQVPASVAAQGGMGAWADDSQMVQ